MWRWGMIQKFSESKIKSDVTLIMALFGQMIFWVVLYDDIDYSLSRSMVAFVVKFNLNFYS